MPPTTPTPGQMGDERGDRPGEGRGGYRGRHRGCPVTVPAACRHSGPRDGGRAGRAALGDESAAPAIFVGQQRFAACVAHELRTPLATECGGVMAPAPLGRSPSQRCSRLSGSPPLGAAGRRLRRWRVSPRPARRACSHQLPGMPPRPSRPSCVRVVPHVAWVCGLRTHGFPSFPDPTGQGAFNLTGSGIQKNSPQFKAAIKECIPSGGLIRIRAQAPAP